MQISLEKQNLPCIWQEIIEIMNNRTDPFKNVNTVYQFEISGEQSGVYQLTLKDGKATVKEGAPDDSECTIILNFHDFKELLAGNLNSTTSYMRGRLKVNGSLGLALRLETLLKQYH
ncbi:SCP2 sterol-binding domain-containing protein [Lederbergia citri]|uniref:SCP2 sterol-binding domain-containing protein n=1 Tax=Lederbergia citri TaxID=2833580 RepID=A0A942TJN3_9BACI|nr:SCP2 sterol-binding domain-containing protein [Lederbergia citri]MBS4197234.1 SCP2 sterol-binding domain-containing protein [Lederbergia citri]